jgi:hypothetical protein
VSGVDQHALRHLVLNSGEPPVRTSRTFFGFRSADGLQGLREGARPKVQEKNGDRNTRQRYHPKSGEKVQTWTDIARRGSSIPGVSGGALRDETLPPREKSVLALSTWPKKARFEQTPARHKSKMAGATRTAT